MGNINPDIQNVKILYYFPNRGKKGHHDSITIRT